MTQKEMRLKRKEILNKRLAHKFECITINETTCFLLKSGEVCRLESLGEEFNALVIEYADNLDLAKRNIFGEDGDLFYMDELDEDAMYNAMIQEIEDI